MYIFLIFFFFFYESTSATLLLFFLWRGRVGVETDADSFKKLSRDAHQEPELYFFGGIPRCPAGPTLDLLGRVTSCPAVSTLDHMDGMT